MQESVQQKHHHEQERHIDRCKVSGIDGLPSSQRRSHDDDRKIHQRKYAEGSNRLPLPWLKDVPPPGRAVMNTDTAPNATRTRHRQQQITEPVRAPLRERPLCGAHPPLGPANRIWTAPRRDLYTPSVSRRQSSYSPARSPTGSTKGCRRRRRASTGPAPASPGAPGAREPRRGSELSPCTGSPRRELRKSPTPPRPACRLLGSGTTPTALKRGA